MLSDYNLIWEKSDLENNFQLSLLSLHRQRMATPQSWHTISFELQLVKEIN